MDGLCCYAQYLDPCGISCSPAHLRSPMQAMAERSHVSPLAPGGRGWVGDG